MSTNKSNWSSRWIGFRGQKWMNYFNRNETSSTDKEFSTYYRSTVCPSPDDYPMLWQSRSSSRIDAASLLAASSTNSSGTSNSDAVTQLPLAQRARLCSSTSNLQRVITAVGEKPSSTTVDSPRTHNDDSSLSLNLNSNDANVFSTKGSKPPLDTVTPEKQQKSSNSNSSTGGTSSLGRYASKLKSQLPPIHFGFENKKQANNPTNNNQSSSQNSAARSVQRSSSGKTTTELTTAAPVVNNLEATPPLQQPSETFTGKISRSIYDLTSIERLRNWKAKLPSIRTKNQPHTPTTIVEKKSENQSDESFPSAVPTFSGSILQSSNSQIPKFQQAVTGEETLNGKNIKYDLPINTSTPSTTIPTVNLNQFCESRQTTTKVEFSSDDHRSRLENCDSGSRSCVENRSNSNNFLSRNSPTLQRNSSDTIITGTDTPIRQSIGLLLAQTESIVTMASNNVDNVMNTSKSSVDSGGKFELQNIFGTQKKSTDDENKVYEEIDFPGWSKNGKDKNGQHLPPPARITPFSGIPQNKMGDVVRPTAFRPVTMSTGVSTDLPPKRPVTIQQNNIFDHFAVIAGFQETSGAFAPPLPPPRQALSAISPKQYPSDTEAERYFINSFNYNKPDPPKYPSDSESMGTFYTSYHQRVAPHGPKHWSEMNSNNTFRHSPNVKQRGSLKSHTNSYIFANGEHDYDLVISTPSQDPKNAYNKPNQLFPASSNEFLQKRPLPSLPNQKHSLAATNSFHGYQNQVQMAPNTTDNGQSVPNYYSTTGSYSSRNSSGIHVTPSPSDSGMVELETVLKEKESELLQLRQTMEHNEQVIVRVYQEKEERWQDKLREWASRLEQAVSTEQKLLSQIQRLQDDRNELQTKVQTVAADKQGLQRKCKELESELFSLKQQMHQNKESQWDHCSRCDNLLSPQSSSSQEKSCGDKSPDTNVIGAKKSPTPAEELRTEVDGLKDEVANLRKSLHDQVFKFSHERKSWEIEKQRVLQYHKILQDSYSQLLRQNGVPNPIITESANFMQQQVSQSPRFQKT